MSIRFFKYWRGMHPGSTATYSQATEQRLINDGYAMHVNSLGADMTTSSGFGIPRVPLTPAEQADAQARITAALARYD